MKFQELKAKAMQNEDFKKEWDTQAPFSKETSFSKESSFWQIQEQLIQARIDSKLTQEQIADKMQVAQSAVARFENARNGCNINTLIGYARAVGLKKIVIDL